MNLPQLSKVEIRKSYKGRGIYAISKILKDEIVCYYSAKVTKYSANMDCTYAVSLYYKNGASIQHLYGNLDTSRLNVFGVPCCGYLINEPGPGEDVNVYMSYDISKIYGTRRRVMDGDAVVYTIVSERDIAKNEEILIDYGPHYVRSAYEFNNA